MCLLHRLSLDKSEVAAAENYTAEDVLLMASLSARWENADAIDTAITAAVEVQSFTGTTQQLLLG